MELIKNILKQENISLAEAYELVIKDIMLKIMSEHPEESIRDAEILFMKMINARRSGIWVIILQYKDDVTLLFPNQKVSIEKTPKLKHILNFNSYHLKIAKRLNDKKTSEYYYLKQDINYNNTANTRAFCGFNFKSISKLPKVYKDFLEVNGFHIEDITTTGLHRFVAAHEYNISDSEVDKTEIHHRNIKPLDNNIKNLIPIPKSNHQKYHELKDNGKTIEAEEYIENYINNKLISICVNKQKKHPFRYSDDIIVSLLVEHYVNGTKIEDLKNYQNQKLSKRTIESIMSHYHWFSYFYTLAHYK